MKLPTEVPRIVRRIAVSATLIWLRAHFFRRRELFIATWRTRNVFATNKRRRGRCSRPGYTRTTASRPAWIAKSHMNQLQKVSALPENRSETVSLKPHFDDVQAHYDLSDEFF